MYHTRNDYIYCVFILCGYTHLRTHRPKIFNNLLLIRNEGLYVKT